MDPQACTVIVLRETNPFYILDNEQNTMSILKSAFGHVHEESILETCLNYIQLLPSSSTILLIELDESSQPFDKIHKAVDQLSKSVPVIVCSSNQDPQFMLDCIQAGAADYLLKPLRADMIKTLFLSLHRRPTYEDQSSSISTVTSSPITPTSSPSAYLPDRIQDRIKELNNKESNFTKAIIDTYIPRNALSSCKPLNSEQKYILDKKVSDWDFSPLDLTQDELVHCTVIIISQVFTLTDITVFSQDQLYNFVIELASIYHDENPYHNFAHAVDVLQCIYYFLCQLGLVPFADGSPKLSNATFILKPRDIFALFIAAIGHDTAHPGVNNAFLINTSAPLALLYNDSSVLESFHAMTLFQLLKKHKFDDLLGGRESQEYLEFRKVVISSILATDMALHNDYVTKIKEQKFTKDTLEERLLFCSGLIKCADISNVARPFPRAYEWAQILIEEFTSQGDLEKELGMPVSPMNDRAMIVLEDTQIGFIKFVALNLFETVRYQLQELSFPVDYIKKNLTIWENRKREKQEEDRGIVDALRANSTDSNYTLSVMPMADLSNDKSNHQEWDPREDNGAIYCQCNIQ